MESVWSSEQSNGAISSVAGSSPTPRKILSSSLLSKIRAVCLAWSLNASSVALNCFSSSLLSNSCWSRFSRSISRSFFKESRSALNASISFWVPIIAANPSFSFCRSSMAFVNLSILFWSSSEVGCFEFSASDCNSWICFSMETSCDFSSDKRSCTAENSVILFWIWSKWLLTSSLTSASFVDSSDNANWSIVCAYSSFWEIPTIRDCIFEIRSFVKETLEPLSISWCAISLSCRIWSRV